jgi:hypothetical protein
LITYEIVELKPMLKVREATRGTGGVFGSSILNRIFQKHLEDRFKGMRGWDEEVLEEAMEKFEKVRQSTRSAILLSRFPRLQSAILVGVSLMSTVSCHDCL